MRHRLHHAFHVALENSVKQLILQLYLATRVDDYSGLRSRFVLFLVFRFLVLVFLSLPLPPLKPSIFWDTL